MESQYVYDIMARRDKLCDKYQGLIGRHAFYNGRRPLVVEGLRLLDEGARLHVKRLSEISTELLKARAAEKVAHLQRFQTEAGNQIHETEYELYSFAFDVFQTAADHEKLRISAHN
jgi:hypothetical protein